MLINFNVSKLDDLLYDFYNLTGLRISIWDADFHQLSYQPKELCSFCRIVKSTPSGKQRCFQSDKEICAACAKSGMPETHYCHAGLLDTAVPIQFKDSIMGYMIFGQITDSSGKDPTPILKTLSQELHISLPELQKTYNHLNTFDQDYINSAANILKMATRYLWLSNYIEIGYNTAASHIDDYIRTHIRENITIQTLCDEFGISKNRLYDISHEWFKMTIGEYVSAMRIREAKRLLSSSDIPISQIGPLIGINDYNYFSRFFKKNVGVTPHRYRREFPDSMIE